MMGQKLTGELVLEGLILLFKPVLGTPIKVVGAEVTVAVGVIVVPLVRGTAGPSEAGVVFSERLIIKLSVVFVFIYDLVSLIVL